MSKPLQIQRLPEGIATCSGTIEQDGDWHIVNIAFELGGSEISLESRTDVVLVIDASFSMFARAYRNGRIFDLADQIMSFVAPFDEDGVDIYFHSLRAEPFKYIGAHADSATLQEHLSNYVEARTAARVMGQKTVLVPALDDIIRLLKEEKGSERVFIEVITDGVFDDEEELRQRIIDYGNRFNSEDNPYGLRFHFTGVGVQGAQGLRFLEELDDHLTETVEGWIDCVEFHSADTVEANVASIVNELKASIQLAASNGLVTIQSDAGEPSQVCRMAAGSEPSWEHPDALSFEHFPPSQSFSAAFATPPSSVELSVMFLNDATGEFHEHTLSATVA